MDVAAAIHVLRERVPGIRVVWLYGSHARGDARPDSDVDLALLADAPGVAPVPWTVRGL